MKFQDKFYPKTLQNTLQDFRSEELLCDVKLVVDGHEFPAHKLILAAASPYFRAMFNSQSSFIESKQENVHLHGIEMNALSDILQFIYTSDIDLNDENVYVLMEAANLFQIYALRTFIGFYLQCSLTIENCLQVYVMAKLHHYHDLAVNALQFLLVNFSKIVEKEELTSLPFEVVSDIVSSKLLDVSSEEKLYEIILKWVKEDIKSRIHNLEPLLAKLDLKLFSIEFLEKIKNNMLVTDRIQQRVEDIIGYKTARGLLNQMIDSEATYSFHKFRHKAEKAVILAIGGESSGMASQSVECYTLGYDKWRYIVPEFIIKRHETQNTNVLPPLRCARYYAASAHDSYHVYVIGGRNSTTLLDECEVFHIRTNQWNYFHQLPEKLFASGAAFLEGELFVVGGCNEEGISNKVWKLDKAHKIWKMMPPLNFPRYFHGTIASGGYIYVLGGYDSKTQAALKTCMKFDPGSNKWFKISGMHQARAKFGCAAVDNFIYVFGGTSDESNCLKSVERYNTFIDEWTYETSMTIPRHSFSVAVSDHEIFCMGGSDSTHFLDTVEKFSLRTKRWHCVHSMQISRLAPSAAALSVPYFPGVSRDIRAFQH